MEINKLDLHLYEVIKHMENLWFEPNVGIVACALIDLGDRKVFATSEKTEDGKWLHAERNALNKFESIYGAPTKNAIFVTTLSPCDNFCSSRAGESCVNLILNSGISRVHFGSLEPHHNGSLDCYSNLGISSSLTKETNLLSICDNIANLFSIYGSKLNDELVAIKKQCGTDLFHN